MDAQRLPGAPARDGERIVAHVDMDCFYAACERLREPALDGEPLVVGMGFEPGETIGAVATASYEAREYGVESAMATPLIGGSGVTWAFHVAAVTGLAGVWIVGFALVVEGYFGLE